jgi:hypothetical protein
MCPLKSQATMLSHSDMILIRSSKQSFVVKVMPLFSCDDTDDSLQNQAQVANLDIVGTVFLIKSSKMLTIIIISSSTLHLIPPTK